MATYRQKLKAQEDAARLQAASQLRAEQESARKMSLSPAECYSEGYAIGFEHGTDGYEGTVSARGEGFAYPEDYARGYRNGWEAGNNSLSVFIFGLLFVELRKLASGAGYDDALIEEALYLASRGIFQETWDAT